MDCTPLTPQNFIEPLVTDACWWPDEGRVKGFKMFIEGSPLYFQMKHNSQKLLEGEALF